MGVYTEASAHKSFTVSIKQSRSRNIFFLIILDTFAAPGQSKTTAGDSSNNTNTVVPSMLLMVIAYCLFLVM